MSNLKLGEGYELCNIYSTLRKLKSVHKAQQGSVGGAAGGQKSILDVTLFTTKFLLKLLDGRISELNSLCEDLLSGLFKRFKKKVKQPIETSLTKQPKNTFIQASKCLELDEFFHYCLYYLHDFFIELNWHETITNLDPEDLDYVESKLESVQNFLTFQKALTANTNEQHLKPKSSPKERSSLSPPKSVKSIKSSLASSSRLESPTRKRRVRFADTSPEDNRDRNIDTNTTDQNLITSHSLFALDLLLFGLSLFIQHLYNDLIDWQSTTSNLKDSLKLISESKQKLRTNQLVSISKRIKSSNDVYLTILDYLYDLRKIYLKNCVLNILCSQENNRQLCLYKAIRINTFIGSTILDVERKVLSNLAEQCLQILLDLVISEINLPPVELTTGTQNKTKVELGKSRENYLNFITSWMNVDDIVFGFMSPKKRTSQTSDSKTNLKHQPNEPSTLTATGGGGQFKSSSRILAQMDNLNELMRDLITEICDRFQSNKQMKYFLELVHVGLELSFDRITNQLNSQLSATIEANHNSQIVSTIVISTSKEVPKDLKDISKTVDILAFKVRSLKFIHILSSVDKLIKETATINRIEIQERSLERKLEEFTQKCTQQTGSTYKS